LHQPARLFARNHPKLTVNASRRSGKAEPRMMLEAIFLAMN